MHNTNGYHFGTTTLILIGLTLVCITAQVVPFLSDGMPDEKAIAATILPPGYPPGYTATDFARARAFTNPLLFGGIARSLSAILAVLALVCSGIATNFGGTGSHDRKREWLHRILFLLALFLLLRAVELPFALCRFKHYHAFGLTPLTFTGWGGLFLLALPIPLAVFTLKYLLVVCTFPLFKRSWWIAACLLIFLITDVMPEVVSRTYPLDPVTTLSPLEPSSHAEALSKLFKKEGLDMPIIILDQSKRSNTANIYISGRPGREYVVLTDTFLSGFTPEETALALSHEIGHFRNRGALLLTNKALAFLTLILGFGLAFMLTGRGVVQMSSAMQTVMIVMLCVSACAMAAQPLSNAISRSQERLADQHALRKAADPAQYDRLLVKLAQLNLEPLTIPRWKAILFSDYPSVMERLSVVSCQPAYSLPPGGRAGR